MYRFTKIFYEYVTYNTIHVLKFHYHRNETRLPLLVKIYTKITGYLINNQQKYTWGIFKIHIHILLLPDIVRKIEILPYSVSLPKLINRPFVPSFDQLHLPRGLTYISIITRTMKCTLQLVLSILPCGSLMMQPSNYQWIACNWISGRNPLSVNKMESSPPRYFNREIIWIDATLTSTESRESTSILRNTITPNPLT